MRGSLLGAGWAALAAAAPASAQAPLDLSQPRVVPDGRCRPTPESPDEIVVCGRPDEDSRYRIPPALRDSGTIEDRNAAWTATQRDQASLERFGDQMIGPAGAFQHQRQIECEWRAARQQARGERPDCTRSELPFFGR